VRNINHYDCATKSIEDVHCEVFRGDNVLAILEAIRFWWAEMEM